MMLMASDVARYMIDIIRLFGDLPCVLEHHSSEEDGIMLDPLMSTPVMTIYQTETHSVDQCVCCSRRNS